MEKELLFNRTRWKRILSFRNGRKVGKADGAGCKKGKRGNDEW